MSRRPLHPRATAPALTALVVAGLCAATVAQAPLHDERTESRRLQFSGEGVRTLEVRTISGSIRVTGDGGTDVRLEATTSIEAETDEAIRAARRDVVIEGREQGTTVAIAVRDGGAPTCGEQGPWPQSAAWWDRRQYDASVTLTIRVPRDVRVRLCTVNGGDVVADGTLGDFDVSNVNGSIAVTLPRDLAAELRHKTLRGTVYTDFDTVDVPAAREPSRRPGQPRFVYRQRGFTTARVGAGGPRPDVRDTQRRRPHSARAR